MTAAPSKAVPAEEHRVRAALPRPRTRTQPLTNVARQPFFWAVAVVALFWLEFFKEYWVFQVTSSLIVGVVALGLMVLVGWIRQITLAQAAMFGTALYMFAYLYRPVSEQGGGWNFFAAGALSVGLCAAMTGAVSLIGLKLPGIYVMVLTLGLEITVEQTIFTVGKLTSELPGSSGVLQTPRPKPFGISLASAHAYYWAVLAVVVLIVALLVRFKASPWGRALLLAGTHAQAAAATGVSPRAARLFGFVAAGALAGIAGVFEAMLLKSAPSPITFTTQTSLTYLGIAILAGFDSTLAVLLVAVAMGLGLLSLERFHLNELFLAGAALLLGTALGSRGVGGWVKDRWMDLRLGKSVERKLAKATRLTASELRQADGVTEVSPLISEATRQEALAVLEKWFPVRYPGPRTLRAKDLSLAFGGVKALDHVTLDFPTGKFIGLIGPNGAGKSSLFDVVSGIRRPDAGRVELCGQDVTDRRAWHRAALGMSRTFQTARVRPDITIAENLLAGAYPLMQKHTFSYVAGMPSAWRELRAAEDAAWAVAQLLSIDKYWDERAGDLEFSARRRTEIGRALLAGPQVLLLDEPATGLDPSSSAALFSLIRRLQADLGLTVVLVEHYVKAVMEASDLIFVLAQGRVIARGEPSEVAADEAVKEAYLRDGSGDRWADRGPAPLLPERPRKAPARSGRPAARKAAPASTPTPRAAAVAAGPAPRETAAAAGPVGDLSEATEALAKLGAPKKRPTPRRSDNGADT